MHTCSSKGFCQCKSHSKLQKSKKISVFAHFSAFTFLCPYTLSQNFDGFSKKLAQNVYQIVIKLFQAAFFNTIFFDKFFFGPVQQKIVKWKFKTILMQRPVYAEKFTHSSFSHSKTPIQFHQTSLVLNFRSKEIFGFRTCTRAACLNVDRLFLCLGCNVS